MATSGTINGNTVDGPNRVILTWSVAEQDTANNRTRIAWNLYWYFSGSVTCRDLDNGVAVINGTTVYSQPGRIHSYVAGHHHPGNFAIASGSLWIAHNSDGTKTFSASCGVTGWLNARSSGSGSWSLPTIQRYPSAPGNPTFSNIQPTSVTVSWTAPSQVGSGLTQRQVQISTNSSFSAVVKDSTASWGTSYSATGLAKGTQYYARVRAATAAGWGPWSGVTSFTTTTTVPGAPPQPSVGSIDFTTAVVSWSAPSDNGGTAITSYDVQRATNSGFSSGVVTVQDNASPYTLTGLVSGTTYWVRVRARNARGAGDWSASRSFTTKSSRAKTWNGSAWVDDRVFTYSGSGWQTGAVRTYSGSGWN